MTFLVAQKWLFKVIFEKSDPKMTPKFWLSLVKSQILSHFWVTFPWVLKNVIFESLWSHFNCFAIPGPVAPSTDHKTWEGGERRKIRFSEQGESLNGPDLFTELAFLYNSLPTENLNGHRHMATGKWTKNDHQKAPRSFSHFFACFRWFSIVFGAFSLVCALFGLSVSDRFCPSIFALFRTIRLLPFSGCHLDSPDYQNLHWLNARPSFSEKALLFTHFSASSHPMPQTLFQSVAVRRVL